MSRRRRAFTLVEILVSIIILGVVMSAVLTIFYSVFESYRFHQDIDEAKQRGQNALAAIAPYVINAGLGMPNTKNHFQDSFAGLTALLPAAGNLKFEIPVQLARDGEVPTLADDKKKGDELWLVYSVPTGAGINFEYEFMAESEAEFSEDNDEIENISKLDLVKGNKDSFKGWVTFPASLAPFWVTDLSSKVLKIETKLKQKISAFDEIHYVRAVKIKVNDKNNLVINHLDGSGEQPASEGIFALWCTFDPEGDRVLQVSVLARADTKHGKQYQTGYEGWPSGAPMPQGEDLKYRYAVVSRSWRIRN